MPSEVATNFADFENRWKGQWSHAEQHLATSSEYFDGFKRLISIQAWRSEILEDELSDGAHQFILEGQNDLLISYILARSGQWRSSLQTQRAAIENYLNGLYFMDHPVELELWDLQKFKNQTSDLFTYFTNHPKNIGRDGRSFGIPALKAEYATLSKAVHGSAKPFRMTRNDGPKFFSEDAVSLAKWASRNRMVVRGLNLLLLSLLSTELQGSKRRNLRKAIAFSLRQADKSWIKAEYNVSIPF